jgi:hypothetical protein
MRLVITLAASALLCVYAGTPVSATSGLQAAPSTIEGHPHWDVRAQLDSLRHASISLPLAAALGAVLAFRPRRRGTPERSAPVIQTQIILAIVGAAVMLIVGASLARAFAIVGAASLIRYRAKIDDPKDAGVMLTTLTVGLASGVELYGLAVFGTAFVLGILWVVESLEPERYKLFMLSVSTKDPSTLKPQLEQLLRRHRLGIELRSASTDEISYEVQLPVQKHTDRISNEILALDKSGETTVEWEEKKTKS